MGKQKETDGQYVKKETMLVVALVAVIVGFLGGVVFSAYKSGVGLDGSAPGPSGQTAQKQDISNNLAQEINDLEKEISLHPENIEALIRLGNLYFDTEQPGKAIMAYNNALEL
ncbi:MAG: hypothetical protein ISR61_03800, partial [Desulfobacteraceae bacterium]|nr:hypothetical protein [Desulfobacteraceae bacterium]